MLIVTQKLTLEFIFILSRTMVSIPTATIGSVCISGASEISNKEGIPLSPDYQVLEQSISSYANFNSFSEFIKKSCIKK